MSSSGLIYAVIVGAWAAYLVPMWLRRQDELNEARPTERFSTAIRLLSGRAGMERRYAKDLECRNSGDGEPERDATGPDAMTDAADVRSFAVSATGSDLPHSPAESDETPDRRLERPAPRSTQRPAPRPAARPAPSAAERARRSKVLARRRRTTMVLFLAFTLGSVVAAVGGLAFLWAPAVPAILLSAYIAHLRAQERRRFAFTMDQRHAEAAAQRLRERRPRPSGHPDTGAAGTGEASREGRRAASAPADAPAAGPGTAASPHAAGRRALVEQTDHAEWVDQQRERGRPQGDSWDPVPVPLPTYVTAPVAPRATGSMDLDAPDAWSSARSSTAEPAPEAAPADPADPGSDHDHDPGRAARRPAGRRARERGRTPLFDQYAHPPLASGTGDTTAGPERGSPGLRPGGPPPSHPGDMDRPRAANE